MVKAIKWLGSSRKIIQGFVREVRAEIGYQLYRVEQGLMPTDFKPMPNVGAGVFEIRLHHPHEHRVFYISRYNDRVYVLHAFIKKTQKTTHHDLKIAQKNYQDLMNRIHTVSIKE